MGEYLVKGQDNLGLSKNEFARNYIKFSDNHRFNQSTYSQKTIPAELLILNRYGVGYPYLKAAWKLSQKYHIPPFEILIKAKVISLKIWLDSQYELVQERERIRAKRQQEALLLEQAISNLSNTLPHYSAKRTFTTWQVFFIAFCILGLVSFFYINPESTAFSLILFMTIFYTASICLRGLLLASFKPQPSPKKEILINNDEDLPVYSVLVALYKEANQVDALTQSLWKLDWPKHKLDIKLICEADDHETIAAVLDAKLPNCFELIKVPPQNPRTKPKALNYALPLCRGEYAVLYDAEDHPSPGQLREAYLKFKKSDDKLACLQAPLHIHNNKQNWLTSMFAIEYLTLFNGILPVLAKWRVPIPLGGTSNHFNGLMYQAHQRFGVMYEELRNYRGFGNRGRIN